MTVSAADHAPLKAALDGWDHQGAVFVEMSALQSPRRALMALMRDHGWDMRPSVEPGVMRWEITPLNVQPSRRERVKARKEAT